MRTVNLSVLLALSVLLGSCANTETLTAQAAHFGVSREFLLNAENAGYAPRIRHGETEFCTHLASFSYISRLQCFDASAMRSRLQQQATFRRSVRNAVKSAPASYASPSAYASPSSG